MTSLRTTASVLLALVVAGLLAPVLTVQNASAGGHGELQGRVIVEGRDDRGGVVTQVVVVSADISQPISAATAAEGTHQLSETGEFLVRGLADGRYLVALENDLLRFRPTPSSLLAVRVGDRVIELPAYEVTVGDGRQTSDVIFVVTPATERSRPPAITAPRPGDGDVRAFPSTGQTGAIADDEATRLAVGLVAAVSAAAIAILSLAALGSRRLRARR
jgi:hypothetical protein